MGISENKCRQLSFITSLTDKHLDALNNMKES